MQDLPKAVAHHSHARSLPEKAHINSIFVSFVLIKHEVVGAICIDVVHLRVHSRELVGIRRQSAGATVVAHTRAGLHGASSPLACRSEASCTSMRAPSLYLQHGRRSFLQRSHCSPPTSPKPSATQEHQEPSDEDEDAPLSERVSKPAPAAAPLAPVPLVARAVRASQRLPRSAWPTLPPPR